MRPLDLLAFKVDDAHKSFIKKHHPDEKNYKVAKSCKLTSFKNSVEAYSWGFSHNYCLGYTHLTDEKKVPKRIPIDSNIKLIELADTFTVALSKEGRIYSWGQPYQGHLGRADELATIEPKQVKVDFDYDKKKLK